MIEPLDLSPYLAVHPRLETDRLILRKTRMEDVGDVFAYASDPEVMEFMAWAPHTSIGDTRTYLDSASKVSPKKDIGFVIELKATGRVIGGCGYHHFDEKNRKLEAGYVLHRHYWGQGYVTEALRALIRYAFDEMGVHRLEAWCDVRNARSIRVMEKCGMTCEGILREHELRRNGFVTQKVYGILSGEHR